MSDLQEKTEEQEQPTAFMVALSNGRRIKVQSVMTNSENDEVVTSEHEMIVPDDVPTVKGMGYEEKEPSAEMAMTMGPTSFEEIDAIEEAVETQSRLSELYHKFTQITRNVLHSMGLTPDEKVSAINQATGELQTRLSETVKTTTEGMDKKAFAKLVKQTVTDTVSEKQATKTEGGVNYRASDYADVPDAEKPSTWKLRLAEGSSGNFTVEQVARAITAMQPSGFRGQRVQLGQSRATVASKISGVINRLSATDEQKAKLRKRLNAVKAVRTGFEVVKSVDGRDRWLGWVSNNFIDRDGEILTEKAHEQFITYLDKHPDQAPELWTFHIQGTARKSKADFWAYLNGFLVMGGDLTPQEAKAFNELGDVDLAMSHGFYIYKQTGNEIGRYRTFEVSVLPRDKAANPWTDFTTVMEVNMAKQLSDEQRKLAVALHGEDFVTILEETTQDRKELLDALGIQNKAEKERVEAETETKDETAVTEQGSEQETKAEDDESQQPEYTLDDIVKGVVKALNLEELAGAIKAQNDKTDQTLKAIDERLKALETETDEKMEKMLTPRGAGFNWSSAFRPSTSDKTVMSEDNEVDKDLKEKAPKQDGANWVVETFGRAVAPNGH